MEEKKEQKTGGLYTEIKEIKRAILYLSKTMETISKHIEELKAAVESNQQFYADLLEIRYQGLARDIEKKFYTACAGTILLEDPRFEREFEQWKEEFKKMYEEQQLKYLKSLYEMQYKRMKESIEYDKIFKEFYEQRIKKN